ncbi:MAG: hypothetical protein VXW87_04380 [Pseudomonadota bacterium]|nr:hypothetical protein [Pseudomonadota bacterium]
MFNAKLALQLCFTSTLLVVLCQANSTEDDLDLDLLEDISLAIADSDNHTATYENSWEHANLSHLPLSRISSFKFNNADVWSGATKFRSAAIDHLSLTQVVLDILLGSPTSMYTASTFLDKKDIDYIFTQNTNQAINDKTHIMIRNVLSTISDTSTIDNKLYELLFRHHSLVMRSMSCSAYWEGREQMGRETLKVGIIPETRTSLPVNFTDCQTPICTTRRGEAFSGFYKISRAANTLSSDTQALSCNALNGNQQQLNLCEMVKRNTAQLPFIDLSENAVPSLASGEKYMANLYSSLQTSTQALQSLLALRINTLIKNRLPSSLVSSRSLYTPTGSTGLPSCESRVDGKALACGKIMQGTDPEVTSIIDKTTGLSSNYTAIAIAPSSFESSENTITVLIAGEFITFSKPKDFWVSNKAKVYQNNDLVELPKVLAMSSDTKSGIEVKREELSKQYHLKRNTHRSKTIEALTLGSVANQSLNTIYNQNKASFRYKLTSGMKQQTALQTLAEGSNWRLQSKNNWLAHIATMPNNELLREIVILLAEIKQLQYFNFLLSYQAMVISALEVAASKNDTASFLLSRLEVELEDAMGGFVQGGTAAANNATLALQKLSRST